MLEVISLDSAILSFCFLFLFSLVRLNGKQQKNRDIYELYIELGHDDFEEKIKKPMEVRLHNSDSNVISTNSLNTIIANAIEKSKLGEAGFVHNDLFSSPALEEIIRSHDTLSPICDNSNDACGILNQPTESIPFKIPMGIAEKIMDERYAGDGTVHPSDHLLKLKELCELFEVAGLLREDVMRKVCPFSLKDKSKEWYSMLDDCPSSWK